MLRMYRVVYQNKRNQVQREESQLHDLTDAFLSITGVINMQKLVFIR